VTGQPTFAEAGFLMNYNAAGAEVLRLTAVFVDKILRGAKPADLPVEQPSRLELVVNLATEDAGAEHPERDLVAGRPGDRLNMCPR
jgi:putative ABC transport system substrate-binding protein